MSMGLWEENRGEPLRVTVGPGADADVRGESNVALQAAVDYVGALGGGTVEVQAGTYVMRDSLHLRPRVTVRGDGPATVLWKPPSVRAELSADLGYGHYDVSLAEPDLFQPGMGVYIRDDQAGGFYRTTATLVYREGDRFGLNKPLQHDYSRARNAVVSSVYPIISGYGAAEARVENLRIDGNAAENEPIDGCRGGGAFLLGSHRAVVRKVIVENFNGDGVSFQQCLDLTLEDTLAQGNTGLGFHPGSGSSRPLMRRLKALRNGSDGLFYCLRVTDGRLEDSEFIDNGGHGISIGGRDTDHVIRNNVIRGNGGCGLYFRPGDVVMAGNRNQVLHNVIEGNCQRDGAAEVHLDAELEDVVLRANTIRPTAAVPGLLIGSKVLSLIGDDNEVTTIEDRRGEE